MPATQTLAADAVSGLAIEDKDAFQAGRVAAVAAVHAVHDTYTGFLPPLLPAFIENLLLSRTEAGLLSVFMQGPSLLQPFIGHLADRVSLRYVLVLAPAVTTSLMSLLGVAPGYGVLALLLTLVGLSSAALHAVAPVIAGGLSGAKLGRGMSFWMVGGELGRTLGPLVVVTAVGILGLRGMPWLMVLGLAASLGLFVLLRDVPDYRPNGAEALPWGAALRRMAPILAPLLVLIGARALVLMAVTTFLPTFLTEEGAGLWLAGAALSLLQGAGVVGALVGGSLSDRLGRRTILICSGVLTPLLLFAFLASGGWGQFPLLLLLGFVLLSTTPALMAMVQEGYPESRALANGIYMAMGFVGQSVAVMAVGAMGDALGLRPAFMVSGAIMLLSLPLVWRLPQGARGAYR